MSRITLSDQLRVANEDAFKLQAEVRELEAKLADGQRQLNQLENAHKSQVQTLTVEWEKKLKSSEDMKLHYSKQYDGASSELEQAHAVLDGVAGAPTREYESASGYGTKQRNVVTRLAGAFLAIAQTGKVTQ